MITSPPEEGSLGNPMGWWVKRGFVSWKEWLKIRHHKRQKQWVWIKVPELLFLPLCVLETPEVFPEALLWGDFRCWHTGFVNGFKSRFKRTQCGAWTIALIFSSLAWYSSCQKSLFVIDWGRGWRKCTYTVCSSILCTGEPSALFPTIYTETNHQ